MLALPLKPFIQLTQLTQLTQATQATQAIQAIQATQLARLTQTTQFSQSNYCTLCTQATRLIQAKKPWAQKHRSTQIVAAKYWIGIGVTRAIMSSANSKGKDLAWYPTVPNGHTTYTWGKIRTNTTTAATSTLTTSSSANSTVNSSSNSTAVSPTSELAPPPPSSTPSNRIPTSASPRPLPQVVTPSESTKRNVLITSALPYVNNVPHLGNIIGSVLSADVYARYCRLRGYNVMYICGTDEYGTATETKALEMKTTPQAICDHFHTIHRGIYEWFDISFNHFGRTTTPQQTQIAQDIYTNAEKNGFIEEGQVEQLYCESCTRFLADRFVEGICPECDYHDARGDQCDSCGKLINAVDLKSPKCKICANPPVVKSSSHLFLRLPKLQTQLSNWITEQKDVGKWSENSVSTTQSWLARGLENRCITRDLKWGTPVPKAGFEDKVFYVWFDAPIGYISITANAVKDWEDWWKNPSNVKLYQFMGKDNIPFHCIMFPASLMAASPTTSIHNDEKHTQWTLLHHINTTEYLNYENAKFSKSRGSGVFGDDVAKLNIPSEVWRFYLLRNRPEVSDSIFLWEDFAAKNNNELGPNLGNYVQRVLSFVKNNFNSIIPSFSYLNLTDADIQFLSDLDEMKLEYVLFSEEVKMKEALNTAMKISKRSNVYLQDMKPWEYVKTNIERSATIMNVAVNAIYLLAVCFEPYMPAFTSKVCSQLNYSVLDGDLVDYSINRADESAAKELRLKALLEIKPGHQIGQPQPLFRNISNDEVNSWRERFSGQEKKAKANLEFPLTCVVGTIVKSEDHPNANHLSMLTIDCGEPAPRTIISALKPHYQSEDLVGRQVIVLTNSRHADIKKVKSEGMLLTAFKNKVSLLGLEAKKVVKNGSLVLPAGTTHKPKPNVEAKSEFKKWKLDIGEGGVARFENCDWVVNDNGENDVRVVSDNGLVGAKIQ